MKKITAVLVILAALAAAVYFFLPGFIEQQRQVPVPPVGESQGTETPGVNMPGVGTSPESDDTAASVPAADDISAEQAAQELPPDQSPEKKETPTDSEPNNQTRQAAEAVPTAPVSPERETLQLTEEQTVKLEQGPVGEPEIIEETTAEAAVLEEPVSRDEPIQEDRVVTLGFIENLAVYIVKNYHPARAGGPDAKHGTLAVSFSGLNKRYGTRPAGLKHSAAGMRAARREILGYTMHPIVLTGIYNLYANHCVDMLQWAAENTDIVLPDEKGKPEKTQLTPPETKELFLLSAAALNKFADGLATIAGSPEIMAGTRAYLNAEVEVLDVNTVLQNALAEKADKAAISEAGTLLKKTIEVREAAKRELIDNIRAACGQECEALDNTELLSMAQWVHRRRPGSPTGNRVGARAVLTAADLMRNMAERLETRAGQLTD